MESTDVKKKLIETLRTFDTVMVATNAIDNPTIHARPMAVAAVDETGQVWFVSAKGSDKTDEARTDRRAVVTAQGKGRFVSLSGSLDVLVDPERARALWKPEWDVWFPAGASDPDLVLMRLRPEMGEYWDESGTRGLRHLFEALLLDSSSSGNGEVPPHKGAAADAKQHAKVPM